MGILASDPLRAIGLQSILEEGLKVRVVVMPEGSRTRSCKPTIVIVDEGFDDRPGFGAPLSHVLVRMPGVAIVALVRAPDSPTIDRAFAAGARAVLPETAEVGEIRACIRAVLRGRTWSPRTPESEVREAAKPAESTLEERFTPKEREVMQWLAKGHSNREIASTMGIDEATVKAHLGRMLRKGHASNRVELTLRALAERRA